MKTNPVCLLTGCIYPRKDLPFTALTDPELRKEQYIRCIRFYLTHFSIPLVFVENSGHDLSSHFQKEISEKKLECLTFEGNNYPVELGKGPGEFNCIRYAMDHSGFLDQAHFVFKITGRYEVQNLNRFVRQWSKATDIYLLTETKFRKQYTDSRFFGFQKEFIPKYLEPLVPFLNDSKGVYFEHILFNALNAANKDGKQIEYFNGSPWIVGVAGSMNRQYKSGKARHFARDIRQRMRYWFFHKD